MNMFFNRAQQTSDTLSLLYLPIWIMLLSLGKREQSVWQGQEDLSDSLTCNSPDKLRDCFCSVSAEITSVIKGQKSKCSVSWLWCVAKSKGSCFTTSLLNSRKLLGYISCWRPGQVDERSEDLQETETSRSLIPVQICLLCSKQSDCKTSVTAVANLCEALHPPST